MWIWWLFNLCCHVLWVISTSRIIWDNILLFAAKSFSFAVSFLKRSITKKKKKISVQGSWFYELSKRNGKICPRGHVSLIGRTHGRSLHGALQLAALGSVTDSVTCHPLLFFCFHQTFPSIIFFLPFLMQCVRLKQMSLMPFNYVQNCFISQLGVCWLGGGFWVSFAVENT